MTAPFEYMEDYTIILNGSWVDINTFDELYDIVAGQIRADMKLWGVDKTIAEWKEKNSDIKLPDDRERAINDIIGYTFRWVKDGLWYDGYYGDDVFNLEFNAYAPDSEFLRDEDKKPHMKRKFKPIFKRKAKSKAKPKSASKDLKGYIVRRPDAPNPIPRDPDYRPGDMTDPEGTPLLFKYKPELGDKADPRAYVNNLDQNLVDLIWILCENDDNPKKALREFGQHKFRSRDSMIKQFNELSYNTIRVCGNDILSSQWYNMSHKAWRDKYRADKADAPEHEYINWRVKADQYANWKNGKVYSGVLIDDPNQIGHSKEIAYVDSPAQLPKGRVVKEYPLDYDNYMVKRYEEGMKREIQNAAPQADRRYTIERAYGSDLTEDDLAKMGVKVDDMKLNEQKSVRSGKVSYTINRSRDTKPKASKKKTTRRK